MKTNNHFPNKRGQSLVEFAISLTFILILLAGAIYFGIGLFYYVAMRDAAQEGALYGSMNPTDLGGIQTRVADSSGPGLVRGLYDSGQLTVAITYTGAACEGNGITVTLQHDYSLNWLPVGAFIEPFIGHDYIRLRAAVTDTILTPPCP
ncbi:MAG: pilus assembly protein [Anaerolineaceae bacterium]|nr:MAG: pilus assembly protein [Anaerolineaceae bacterium]